MDSYRNARVPNLSWEIFAISENALGGLYPFALQAGMVLLGVALTLHFTGLFGALPLVRAQTPPRRGQITDIKYCR